MIAGKGSDGTVHQEELKEVTQTNDSKAWRDTKKGGTAGAAGVCKASDLQEEEQEEVEDQDKEIENDKQLQAAQQQSSDEEEEEEEEAFSRLVPSYPFPADFHLEFQGSRIEAIRHLCPGHPEGTRAIAIFLPGVHGGVGPCRAAGANYDENALYASTAQRLVSSSEFGVDCYRCSWPYMRPHMTYAVGGTCRMLHHGLLEAMRVEGTGRRPIDVIFVGHSLGGAVVVNAAKVVAQHFQATEGGDRQPMEALEHADIRVAGLCTLNGAFDMEQTHPGSDVLAPLFDSRALLVAGDADQVVPPEATAALFLALPATDKRHLVLPGGTHDLLGHKAQLTDELTAFILNCCRPAFADDHARPADSSPTVVEMERSRMI